MNTDTPETDSHYYPDFETGDYVVLADFARKLERERDEARDACAGKSPTTCGAAVRSSDLLAAVVANWPDKTDDAPGHCHNIKGRWDKDGSECQWCKTWQEIRATVAANDQILPQ